jgi:Sugar (and other) transporter
LISEASPVALQNVSWKYYILFMVLNLADFFIIAFFFPETKGARSLSQSKFHLTIFRPISSR